MQPLSDTETVGGEFLPNAAWPEHDKLATIAKFLHPRPISARPQEEGSGNQSMIRGIYYRLWPLSFEEYYGDSEPAIEPLPSADRMPLRIVIWQRWTRTDRLAGWKMFSDKPYMKIGFVRLTDGYERLWSKSLRYARRKWLSEYLGKRYFIDEISFEEFRAAYRHSALPRGVRHGLFDDLAVRMHNPRVKVALYAARDMETRRVAAGLCALTSPSVNSSYYHAGFVMKENKNDPLMAGLLEHWFSQALKERVRFMDFGVFWSKGDPSSWKGFSGFKEKLNPAYFFYPPRLFKFRFLKG